MVMRKLQSHILICWYCKCPVLAKNRSNLETFRHILDSRAHCRPETKIPTRSTVTVNSEITLVHCKPVKSVLMANCSSLKVLGEMCLMVMVGDSKSNTHLT